MPRPAIRRILVATDFSAAARHAFDQAADLAREWRAELVILHAIEPVPLPDDFRAAATVAERLERSARQALAELESSAQERDLRCHGVVRRGTAARAISEVAKRLRADLVVIATHGRSGLSRFFMGSVAEQVVRTAPCAVLTVRDPNATAGVRARKGRRKRRPVR